MKNRIIKIAVTVFGGLLLVVAAAATVAYFGFNHFIAESQPQISGTVSLEGIRNDVEIIRDEYGVPHIYAENEADLYFAVGFAVAQDRLWQMEFMRRLGSGRLSEILGEDLLEVDRHFRVITAARRKVELPEDLTHIFGAFIEGINAFIKTAQGKLPLEFIILRFEPEPWGIDDLLAVFWVMNWELSFGWRVDPVAFDIYRQVGAEPFSRLFPVDDKGGATIVADDFSDPMPAFSTLVETVDWVEKVTGFSPSPASNNWVISGQRTLSGKPILANDTHMSLVNPSHWWEVHMVCPQIEAAGFMIPGLPGLVVGHTREVAWGITNVMVDDVDFYIERFNPDNQEQYRYSDGWRSVRTIQQRIPVRNKAPVPLTIRLTHHGPVVKTFEAKGEMRALAARWVVNDIQPPFRAVRQLTRAANIQDVISALRHWNAPGQNFVFADTRGNIGYWCCAVIPIRTHHNGLLPIPGWSDSYEWQGTVAFEQRPHIINPPEGFIASANNRVAAPPYPYVISTYWDAPDRFLRIGQLLASKTNITVENVQRAQADVYSPIASELVPVILGSHSRGEQTELMRKVKDVLAAWDFRMEKDSVAASVFEVTLNQLLRNLLQKQLGPDLFEKYISLSVFPPRFLRRLLAEKSAVEGFPKGSSVMTLTDDIISKSLKQAVSKLTDTFGGDLDGWQWGKLHTLTFEHILGRRKPLDRLFNIGPYPVNGNGLTVNKKLYNYAKPYAVKQGVSQRMIVDLAHPGSALHVLTTGQSGLKGSHHYSDQVPLYLNHQYRSFQMNRNNIEAHKEGMLTIVSQN